MNYSLPADYNKDHSSSDYNEGNQNETEQEFINSQVYWAKTSTEMLVILKDEDGELFSIEYSDWDDYAPCELITVLDNNGNEIDFNLEGKCPECSEKYVLDNKGVETCPSCYERKI